jgi:transcriptional regulator
MYIPKHFEENDVTVLHGLIQSRPFGTWVAWANGELVVNHLPFLIDASRGELGTLVGHVARANPVWRAIADATPSIVVFQGTQKYITPSWYPSKQETGKVVPTWNYAVVHAKGSPRVIDDKDWLRAHVTELSERHEHERPEPWKVTDAPSDFIDALLNAIIGIEIPLDSLHGKWKLGQNRSAADLAGTIAGLSAQGDDESMALAQLAAAAAKAKLAGG